MFQLIEQYGAANTSNRIYVCDEVADLDNIKAPAFGASAYIIHTKQMFMADSAGSWYEM